MTTINFYQTCLQEKTVHDSIQNSVMHGQVVVEENKEKLRVMKIELLLAEKEVIEELANALKSVLVSFSLKVLKDETLLKNHAATITIQEFIADQIRFLDLHPDNCDYAYEILNRIDQNILELFQETSLEKEAPELHANIGNLVFYTFQEKLEEILFNTNLHP